ncbi:MAG: anaerobic ribonucleoside-triphosphate reductase activating protein [Candidatus Omnitrophica bacterium]|nr:anaerobic ribonucleoside-triphosphate reductase activating protein [Candidatus Omnitrophota bacterium]
MKIGGLQKTSLIDFPGRISCIIFVQGCNLRCPFCHNPELVLPEKFMPPMDTAEIISFLERRKKYLEGAVITGGEPCFDRDFPAFAKKVKEMGYLVKLDTNGTFPAVIKKAIEEKIVDYIAMDIKGPPAKYGAIAGVKVNIRDVEASIALIKNSGLKYEFRTTVVKDLLAPSDFEDIGGLIKGAGLYCLQKFVPSKAVSPKGLSYKTYSDEEFEDIKKIMLKYVKECRVR